MNQQEVIDTITQNVSIPMWAVVAPILLSVAVWYISRGCPKIKKYKMELEDKEAQLNFAIEETKSKMQSMIDKL